MVSLSFSTIVRAEGIVSLQVDEKAPFSGILFSDERANQLRMELIDKDVLEKVNQQLTEEITLFRNNTTLHEGQIKLLTDSNHNLLNKYNDEIKRNETNKYIYFGSGVVITVLSVLLAKQLTK